jgi:hypothetical protein
MNTEQLDYFRGDHWRNISISLIDSQLAQVAGLAYPKGMSTQPQLSLLRDFFEAYFHEDWDCDAENPESVVRRFTAAATPGERSVLADAIVKYAAGFASDKELEERLFRELGCYYMPSGAGTSCKVWLEHIAEALR